MSPQSLNFYSNITFSISAIISLTLILLIVGEFNNYRQNLAAGKFGEFLTHDWTSDYSKSSIISNVSTIEEKNIQVSLNTSKTLNISGLTLVSGPWPSFSNRLEDKVTFRPQKQDVGSYRFQLFDQSSSIIYYYKITAGNSELDIAKLEKSIRSYLGKNASHYGIYFHDLTRDQKLTINNTKSYPPASLSKLPSVILTLRDIDAGKLKFSSTIEVRANLQHGTVDSVAKMSPGDKVSLKVLLNEAILISSNSAHQHLHDVVLGGAGPVNTRMREELEISNFSLIPHRATANSVGKTLEYIYHQTALTKSNNDYLIRLMKNAVLKNGIPAGIPKHPKVEIANKEGFLFGGRQGDTYSDAAIVYGKHTDYILVILNDDAPPFPGGRTALKNISSIIYSAVDRP